MRVSRDDLARRGRTSRRRPRRAPRRASLSSRSADQVVVEARARPASRRNVDERRDLALGDEGAVQALQLRGARRQEEHVARAQQVLGAVLVEDRARVDARRDLERDARREVRLDHARQHVDARALRREHQVDARRRAPSARAAAAIPRRRARRPPSGRRARRSPPRCTGAVGTRPRRPRSRRASGLQPEGLLARRERLRRSAR